MMPYYVYIVRCADTTFYTGICTDVTRRLNEHNTSARGARYTRSRRPVCLTYVERAPDRSAASKREYVLRSLTHQDKEQLSTTWMLTGDSAHR